MAETIAKRIQKRHADTALLIFDWPCHGDDASNKIRLTDCSAYLSNVIEYVKSRFHTDKLYASATSFGGYLVLKYIAENDNPFIRVTFRCPAVNMYDTLTSNILTEDELDTIRKGKPISVGFDRKVKIHNEFLTDLKEHDITLLDYRSCSDNLMIVHGTKDEIVSYDVVKGFHCTRLKAPIIALPIQRKWTKRSRRSCHFCLKLDQTAKKNRMERLKTYPCGF